MDRANIKVSRELFEELREAKGNESWEHYLRARCLEQSSPDIDDVLSRLDRLPKETADEIMDRQR